MNRSTFKRFGLASMLFTLFTMPLCGCGDPNGVQENPYASPAESAAEGTDAATTDEAAEPAAETSSGTE